MRNNKYEKLVLAILIICVFYFMILKVFIDQKYINPFLYHAKIIKYSSDVGLDPNLITAIVDVESKFVYNAKSDKGAIGLMQLMPTTAKWISEMKNDDYYNKNNELVDIDKNLEYGTWYVHYLMEEFKGNKVFALSAYNAGRGNVEEWIEENNWQHDFSDVEKIPFPETREYVKKVLIKEKYYEQICFE